MANFLDDTAVEVLPGEPARCRAALSPEWAVWGPNGGYLAAVALRAAMARSRLPRPASFHCDFLAVGAFAPVEIEVRPLGGGKRAEALRVDLVQAGRLLLTGTAWMVDDGLEGFEHDFGAAPHVPPARALRSFAELAGDEYAEWYPIWRSIEGRPVRWREAPGRPEWHCWLRFNETPIPDRQADALRQLFWLDFPGWNAMISAHAWPFHFLAPNLDLTVQFHRFAPGSEWMLADGEATLACDGIAGCVAHLWSEAGELLATGTSKHVCRRNPSYAEDLARARELGLVPAEG
jgi:acyl-CoA thioesterase